MQIKQTSRRLNCEGFTLVELVVLVGIMAILLSMATMEFNKMTTKSQIENQTRGVLADLMTIRTEALFQKQPRAVKITSTTFSVYSSAVTSGAPVLRKTLSYPMVFTDFPDPLVFSSRGLVEGVTTPAIICIEPAGNAGAVDSIVINTTRLEIGKRNGADCQTEDIETK